MVTNEGLQTTVYFSSIVPVKHRSLLFGNVTTDGAYAIGEASDGKGDIGRKQDVLASNDGVS